MNRTLRILRPVALAWTAIFLIAFVVVPLGVMLWETVSGPDGFTLEAWGEILASPIDREQIGYSMLVGAASVAVSLVFGLGHALLTHRTDLPGAAVLAPLGAAVPASGPSGLGAAVGAFAPHASRTHAQRAVSSASAAQPPSSMASCSGRTMSSSSYHEKTSWLALPSGVRAA